MGKNMSKNTGKNRVYQMNPKKVAWESKSTIYLNLSHILFVEPIHDGEFAQVTKFKKAEKKWSGLYPS